MNVRKLIPLIVIAAVATIPVAAALATSGSGITSTPIARGTLAPQFKIKLQNSSQPGDVVITKFVLSPLGQSGWHKHPGPAVVTVKSGQVTFQQGDCSTETYSAGQVAIEPTGDVHRAVNLSTTTPAEFYVTFLDIPVDGPARIEAETDPRWVEPTC